MIAEPHHLSVPQLQIRGVKMQWKVGYMRLVRLFSARLLLSRCISMNMYMVRWQNKPIKEHIDLEKKIHSLQLSLLCRGRQVGNTNWTHSGLLTNYTFCLALTRTHIRQSYTQPGSLGRPHQSETRADTLWLEILIHSWLLENWTHPIMNKMWN